MRGVLWKWLFGMGMVFWIALCVTDYYKRNIEKHPEFVRSKLVEDELEMSVFLSQKNKSPPALTFWKTLSMVLSVGALVYIKRSSAVRKCPKTRLMLTYPRHDEIRTFSPTVKGFPSNINFSADLKPNQVSPDLPRRTLTPIPKTIRPGIVGVELVQKKLEKLERSVASLKQRHHESNSPAFCSSVGIVSGSPEFRKFMSTCHTLNTTESNSDISINSSQFSETNNVPGSCLVSTTSSSEHLFKQQIVQVAQDLSESNSSATIKNSVIAAGNKNVKGCVSEKTCENSLENIVSNKDAISINLSGKTEDSSWSTISGDVSSNNYDSEGGSPSPAPALALSSVTEILQVKETFSKNSKTSEESKISDKKSLHSIQSIISENGEMIDYEDDVQVPGSTLVPSSENTSICSSSTLMSSSSNNLPSFFGGSSCYSFDDDVLLNTLD